MSVSCMSVSCSEEHKDIRTATLSAGQGDYRADVTKIQREPGATSESCCLRFKSMGKTAPQIIEALMTRTELESLKSVIDASLEKLKEWESE